MPLITLTTDFGSDSPYVAEMKGVILSLAPNATLVDITHAIAPQDLLGAARIVAKSTRFFPANSIHIVVVDPGVGTDRAIVCVEAGGHTYLAPDNGVLSRLLEENRPTRQVRLAEPRFWRLQVSNTFHGRDIFAPVAAYLAKRGDPTMLGPAVESLVTLDWPKVRRECSGLIGQIVAIDSFGNAITNLTLADLPCPAADQTLRFQCGAVETAAIARTYGEHPSGTLVALVGSGGEWELAVVNGSADRSHNLHVGDAVRVSSVGS